MNQTNFLWVTLDYNFSWNDNFVTITLKASKHVPIMRKVQILCSPKSLKFIYITVLSIQI